ncbi:MAG TPA: zinc-ribbon domain-containing protein [Syntrophorhabdales bacterium]|nr:zinc-ribbon domain-containing protein [Syntrophorhabdales bacterium]
MIVTCPSCGRKFNLPDGSIKSPYQKLKCSKCSHTFMLTKEEPEPEQAPPAAKEETQEVQPPRQKPAEIPTRAPFKVPQAEDRSIDTPRRRKGLIALVIVLFVVAAMGAGFYYCWMNYAEFFGIPMGASDKWLSIRNLEGQEIVTKEGTVFLVSGVVFNGSTKGRKFLILRAKLFDKEGKVLAEKDVVSGLSFSKEKIGAMQKLEIEKKLNDFKLSSEENFQAASKKQIPFAVIFFDNTIEKAKEFTVEIVESPIL